MTKVAAIIVTHNGEKWIRECLNCLLNSTIPPEIYVIDNASTDATVSLVNEFDAINLTVSEENLGFGKANNIGLRLTYDNFDYFLLVNQDVYVEANTIEMLVGNSDSDPTCGIVSPIHVSGDRENMDIAFEKYFEEGNEQAFNSFKKGSGDLAYVPFVNAACWLISKNCLKEVGLFHPLFHHYGEDINYAKRAQAKGYKLAISTQCQIVHDRPRKKSNMLTDPHTTVKRRMLNAMLDPDVEGLSRVANALWIIVKVARSVQSVKTKFTFMKESLLSLMVIKKEVRRFDQQELFIENP